MTPRDRAYNSKSICPKQWSWIFNKMLYIGLHKKKAKWNQKAHYIIFIKIFLPMLIHLPSPTQFIYVTFFPGTFSRLLPVCECHKGKEHTVSLPPYRAWFLERAQYLWVGTSSASKMTMQPGAAPQGCHIDANRWSAKGPPLNWHCHLTTWNVHNSWLRAMWSPRHNSLGGSTN